MKSSRNEVVKELSLIYQRTRDPATFERILKRVDNLVVLFVLQEKKKRSYLKRIDLQELYQAGILGVYLAVLSIPEREDSNKIPARFWAYVKWELERQFFKQSRDRAVIQEGLQFPTGGPKMCFSAERIEEVEMRDMLLTALRKGVLTKCEYKILRRKFYKDMTLKSIAKSCGISCPTVGKRYSNALYKLFEFLKKETS